MMNSKEPKKFPGYHITLQILLEKLANPRYGVRDCVQERLSWVYAGCPVFPSDTDRDPC